MIVLWGLSGDSPFEAVRAALETAGAEVAVFDQRRIGTARIELEVGAAVTGTVSYDGVSVDLASVTAAYWRTYDTTQLPALAGAGTDVLQAAWAFDRTMLAWLEVTPAFVVNRASAQTSNSSKPYQGELIRKHGFHIPATLITTDPDAVRSFWTERSGVVYKSISGVRSIVTTLTAADDDRLEAVTTCPTQFQQQVPGRDYRVHVVGTEVFASAVTSDAVDYRYAGQSGAPAALQAADLPDDVAQQCVDLTAALGLQLGGIDLRRAPDGRWFCFEVNPSPGFTYYESHTGQPIAAAVARLMMAAPAAR